MPLSAAQGQFRKAHMSKNAAVVIMLVSVAVIGGGITAIVLNVVSFTPLKAPEAVAAAAPHRGGVVFQPPTPQDAPSDLRDAVMLGYNIMNDTPKYAAKYSGNKLTCANCHFDAGRSKDGISLVGVAAAYPKYRKRTEYSTDLVARTNECFERSMNGRALPLNSHEMQGLIAYMSWISKDLPIYADIPWLGVKRLQSNHQGDLANGKSVYDATCSMCHGANGEGTPAAPPLWGSQSFNDGAGMSHPDILSGFVKANMPQGAPTLTVEQAIDVAGYIKTKPRPHFVATKP
jgi:thiosulfate dehydrogenase